MEKYSIRIFVVFCLNILLVTTSNAQECRGKPLCKDLSSCYDALYQLEVCGYKRLDRDNDGVPCEAICGRQLTPVLKSIKQKLSSKKNNSSLGLISTETNTFKCGKKKYCSEMISCIEAKFYLNQCKLDHLDGDGDGTPCNKLCNP